MSSRLCCSGERMQAAGTAIAREPEQLSAQWSVAKRERTGGDKLKLSGVYAGEPVEIRLERMDERKFRLVNRSFHWIQDYPVNR